VCINLFCIIFDTDITKKNECRLICLLIIIIETNLATVTTEILIQFLV
jgi:hypothetical protein